MVRADYKKDIIFSVFILCVFALVLCAFISSSFMPYGIVAYAESDSEGAVSLESVTGKRLKNVDGMKANTVIADYNASVGYFSDVTAVFAVSTEYYLISYKIDGIACAEERIAETQNGTVEFVATESGKYELTCFGYDRETDLNPVASCTVTFSNDASAPFTDGDIVEPMTVWRRSGTDYGVVLDWDKLKDTESGIKEIRYRIEYNDEVSPVYSVNPSNAGKTSIVINRQCSIVIVCYDAAGNGVSFRYAMNNFDDVPPPMPSYTVSPELKNGVYASRYEITVRFWDDNGNSGLADKQFYTITEAIGGTDENDIGFVRPVTKYFQAKPPVPESIILDKPMDYTVKLYAVDNAGNVSEPTVIIIPVSAFDVSVPTVGDNVVRTIDLFDPEGICTLGLYVSDKNESGVASVASENGEVVFLKGAEANYYYAKFDCLGFPESLTVMLRDNAGNESKFIMPFPYFYDVEINAALERCMNMIRTMNLSEYTDEAISSIRSWVARLESLLSSTNSAKEEIISSTNGVIEAYGREIDCTYIIESVPAYASASIVLELEKSDFAEYKKGATVKVTLSAWEGDVVNYGEKTEFGSSFADGFSLKISYDENAVLRGSQMSEGILVGMNKPTAYYDREMALIDTSTGETVPTEVKNNRIYFRLKKDTDFVLVIEGGKAPTGSKTDEPKTVTAFGNKLPLGTFLGVVCGCGGAAILLVAALLIVKKVRG